MVQHDSLEYRNNWRRNWLDAINNLADLDLQRRTWLDPVNTNPHWSFVEFIECYFDDLDLDAGYDIALRRALVTPAEVEAVLTFHKRLDAYSPPGSNDFDHAAILNDPAWHSVVQEAIRAQAALTKLKTEAEV